MTLEESIKNSIKRIIKEELGINNIVKDTTYRILTNVCNEIKVGFKNNAEIVKEGIKVYKFSIRDIMAYNGRNYKIVLGITYYNFINSEVYEANKYDINCDYATSYSDGKRINHINVYCYGVGGNINKASLQSSIQHEVEHIFQGVNGNKQITSFDNVYNIACQNLTSDNKALMYISNLIYYSYAFEQDGYINSLYAELINKETVLPTWEDIKDTSAYIALSAIRKALKVIEKNREKKIVKDILDSYFNLNIDNLIKTGKSAEKRLLTKIGKILIKVKQDKQKQGIVFESTKPWISQYFLD